MFDENVTPPFEVIVLPDVITISVFNRMSPPDVSSMSPVPVVNKLRFCPQGNLRTITTVPCFSPSRLVLEG